jgi:non-specific serine/threonine protein kinase/serine/threonine-protein kinase
MTAQRWQKIRRLLEEALELPAASHPAFLQMVAAEDPEAAAEVEGLLAAYARMGDFLEDRPPRGGRGGRSGGAAPQPAS